MLERCLAELVRRHEVLRTTFAAPEGRPVQVIAPSLALSLSSIDLSVLPAGAAQAEALRLAAEEARQPFDLAQGPLLRAVCCGWPRMSTWLLFTMHHIVSDGWSVGVLVREVAALYAALAAGRPVAAAGAAGAVRRLRRLAAGVAARGAYCRANWATGGSSWPGPSPLELPTDRPRPALLTSGAPALPVLLSGPLSAGAAGTEPPGGRDACS